MPLHSTEYIGKQPVFKEKIGHLFYLTLQTGLSVLILLLKIRPDYGKYFFETS